MSAGLLIGCIVLAFFGFNLALVAWIVLRLMVDGIWALVGFYTILLATMWVYFR